MSTHFLQPGIWSVNIPEYQLQSTSVAPLSCTFTLTRVSALSNRHKPVSSGLCWLLGTSSVSLWSKWPRPLRSAANLPRSRCPRREAQSLVSCGDLHSLERCCSYFDSRRCSSVTTAFTFLFTSIHEDIKTKQEQCSRTLNQDFYTWTVRDDHSSKTLIRTHLWFFLSSPQTESPRNQRRGPRDWPRWSGRTPAGIRVSVGRDETGTLSSVSVELYLMLSSISYDQHHI